MADSREAGIRAIRRRDGKNRRGSAAVECAVVAPLLVILFIGVLDYGQFINVAQTVSNASREGARSAARPAIDTVTEVEDRVYAYLGNSFPGYTDEQIRAAAKVECTYPLGVPIPDGDLSAVPAGSPLEVTVTLDFDHVQWVGGVSALNGQVISSTTTMPRH